jgi:hypothetical protein
MLADFPFLIRPVSWNGIGEAGIDLPHSRKRCLLRQQGMRTLRYELAGFQKGYHRKRVNGESQVLRASFGQDLAGVASSRKATTADKLPGARSQIRHNAWSSLDKIPHAVQAN